MSGSAFPSTYFGKLGFETESDYQAAQDFGLTDGSSYYAALRDHKASAAMRNRTAAAATPFFRSHGDGGGGGGGGSGELVFEAVEAAADTEETEVRLMVRRRKRNGDSGGAAAADAARDSLHVDYQDQLNPWLRGEVNQWLNDPNFINEKLQGLMRSMKMSLNESMNKLLRDPLFREFLASDFEKALLGYRGSIAPELPEELFLPRVASFCVNYGDAANPPGRLLDGHLMFFDAMHAYDESFLKENKIDKLVSLNVDVPLDHPGIEKVAINVPDNRREGTPQAFLVGLVKAAREVVQGLDKGKRVGINCSEGRNRSALVCLLSHVVYDMKKGVVRREGFYVQGQRLGGRFYRPHKENETLVKANWELLIGAIQDPNLDLQKIQWKVNKD